MEDIQRIIAGIPNLYVRDVEHPMFKPVYDDDPDHTVDSFLMFFQLEQYFSVDSLRFKKVGKNADKVQELFTLPNRKNPDQFAPLVFKLVAWQGWQRSLKICCTSPKATGGPISIVGRGSETRAVSLRHRLTH